MVDPHDFLKVVWLIWHFLINAYREYYTFIFGELLLHLLAPDLSGVHDFFSLGTLIWAS